MALDFTSDGRSLAVGGGQTFALWDLTDPAHPHLTAKSAGNNQIETVAFSPDGQLLVTGGDSDPTKIWDVSDRTDLRLAATLTDRGSWILAAAFSPDGQSLATAGINQQLTLWDLTDFVAWTADPLRSACAAAGRGLTETEWNNYVQTIPYRATC